VKQFGVRAADPVAIMAAVLTIISVAAVARFLPARRTTMVDSMVALRHESSAPELSMQRQS